MSRKVIVRLILTVLSLATGVVILGYLLDRVDGRDLTEGLKAFGLLPFLGFVGLFVVMFVFSSMRWQLIINQHLPKNERMGLWRVYMDRLAGFSASYLTPAAQVGGEPIRIAMQSTGEKRIPVKVATSSVVLDIAFELAGYFAFIAMGASLAIYQGLGDGQSMLVIIVSLLVFLAGLLSFFYLLSTGRSITKGFYWFLPWKRAQRLHRWKQSLLDTEEMMSNFLREDKVMVAKVLLLSFIVLAFRVADVFYLMYFFGIDMTFSQAFLISTLPAIALIMPVPGSVGVLEGGFAAVFAVLAISLNPIAYAIIVRSRDVIFIVLGLVRILMKGRDFIEEKILKFLQ